jgi:hypothetical protein
VPPLYIATADRLYTAAPVGDGLAFVPVTEKLLERRAGRVAVTISYPEVDLPDDERERELAAAIREAGGFDAWIAADGQDLTGTVKITCVTPLASTALVSLVCERVEATVGRGGERADLVASAIPAIVARTFDVQAEPVRALTWTELVLPGVRPQLIVAAALEGVAARSAWLSGQCSAGDPGFSVHATGLDLWPDARTAACPALALDRARLIPFLVPNGLIARTFRLGGPYAEPTVETAPDPTPGVTP